MIPQGPIDRNKTLAELLGGGRDSLCDESDTPLTRRCAELKELPLRELEPGHLRLLIGQNSGLDYTIPMAVDLLDHDPLRQAEFYPGDLLRSVLTAPRDFWIGRPQLRETIEKLIEAAYRSGKPIDDRVAMGIATFRRTPGSAPI